MPKRRRERIQSTTELEQAIDLIPAARKRHINSSGRGVGNAFQKASRSVRHHSDHIRERESFLLLYFGGLVYAGSYMISVGLPQQLSSTYNYDSLQVSLCYIPIALGSIIIRPVIGRLIDANYYRHARKLGVKLVKNQQQEIDGFPIEWARLQIALPLVYLACAAIFSYSWVIGMRHPPLPAILVLLFIYGTLLAGTFQVVTRLNIDVNPRSPAAASAAFQLVRCLIDAGGVALVTPLLNSLGFGWTGT
jgi:hypothetical protein